MNTPSLLARQTDDIIVGEWLRNQITDKDRWVVFNIEFVN